MRTKEPRESFIAALAVFLPHLIGAISDSNDILSDLQIREMQEPGLQFEQEANKARAIRRMAIEAEGILHKIARGMAAEEQLHAGVKSEPA